MPHLSKPHAVVLALWSFGMVVTKSCGLTTVAAFLATLLGKKENTLRQRLREWYWEEKQKRIHSEKPVRMVTERYVIEGERMSYQTDSKKLNLVGGIRTVIYPHVKEKGISHEE